MDRPNCIRHWSDLEQPDDAHYPGDTELMSIGAPLGKMLGLKRLGIHHERLPPGRRTSYPHAESALEEFVFVLDGAPDVWIDGHLHRLRAGESVAFPAGTGMSHTFINNTEQEVSLLVIGEADRPDNRFHYPKNEAHAATCSDRWIDPPTVALGPHGGRP